MSKDKPKQFSTPPAAAPVMQGTMPLAPGKVFIRKPSPAETTVLEKFGWEPGDPVPANLAEVLADAEREATDVNSMPPPVDLRTPPLRIPKEQNLYDLPPEEQAKYADVISLMQQAKQEAVEEKELSQSFVSNSDGRVDNNSINQAIATASKPAKTLPLTIVDDTATVPETNAKSEPVFCKNCGYNQAKSDVVEVTEEDKIQFLVSLLGLKPFIKRYSLFGDRLSVTLRTINPVEADMCFRQLYIDRKKNRVANQAEEAENLARYRAALQVQNMLGNGLTYQQKTTDTVVRDIDADTYVYHAWARFCEVNTSETMHRTLLGLVFRFNELVARLEANVDNPNFWQAIDQAD
jgi:hypothetical protein